MAEPELLLDSNIRLWVVLPIVFITFLVGVIRHYVSILLQSDKKLTLEQVSDRYIVDWVSVLPHKTCVYQSFVFNDGVCFLPWLQLEFIIHVFDGKAQGSTVNYL